MRVTKIGGQAVIEGIMMRGKDMYSLAVRNLKGEIVVEETSLPKKYDSTFFKLPLVRGCVAFVNSLVLGTKILNRSVELSGLEELEEEPSKFEKWIMEKLGDKFNKVLTAISFTIAIAISLLLFVFLPVYLTNLITPFFTEKSWFISLSEGIIRMIIFISYLFLISKNKDIQRTFQYHGAEHKTIACFEAEEELTVENVRKHTKLHKRCGTSFLFLVMFVSIIFFMFFKTDDVFMRITYRIIFLPVIAGISYEFLRLAGDSDSIFVKIFSYPGLKLQNLTTQEPDDDQIEVAIVAMNKVLEHQEG